MWKQQETGIKLPVAYLYIYFHGNLLSDVTVIRRRCRHLICHIIDTLIEKKLDAISPWRWRQHGPLKHWYPAIAVHDITTEKTTTCIFIAMRTSNLT